ncbi:CpXC domain-containing protein [Candidatus Micrarchaeota archaeon]|nr:CpXC domain-containing protein [Candidatus Micrarchaeota archaeon]
MTDIRRTIKCSNCGTEAYVQLSSELDLKELVFAGTCGKCGNTIQVNYNIIEKTRTTESEEETVTNLDDSIFSSEIQNDTLKDIMED